MQNNTNGKYELKTIGGYDLREVISTIQKEIRRGNAENSMYWAFELWEGGFHNYLWKRLKVIANEDIGIANPQAIVLTHILAEEFADFLKDEKDGSARLCLANAILFLCNGKKTRAADDFQCVVRREREAGKRLEIPDYALDKHTVRGRKMGRGFDHWQKEGCELKDEDTSINQWRERADKLRQKGEGGKLFEY